MEIIKLENKNGNLTATSLEIARVTGKHHTHVMRDIKEEFVDYPNLDSDNYRARNGQMYIYFILDEYQTLQLMSRYSKEVRTMVINEYKRMKEHIKAQQTPMSLEQMTLEVINGLTLKLEQSEERRKEVTGVLEAIQTYGDNLLFGEFVKIIYNEHGINIGEREFRKKLKTEKYIMSNNMPYAKYKKYFNVNTGTRNGHAYKTTRLTAKGQLYFTNKMIKEL